MKRLTHPNIVKTIHIPFKFLNEDKSMPVLCMEYCTMGDLRKVNFLLFLYLSMPYLLN